MKIQNCKITFHCPRHWEHLDLTDDTYSRYCSICDKSVHYAETDEQAMEFAKEDKCVAVKRSENIYVAGSVAPEDELKYKGVKVSVSNQELSQNQLDVIKSIIAPEGSKRIEISSIVKKPFNIAYCKTPKEQQVVCEKLVLNSIKHKVYKW